MILLPQNKAIRASVFNLFVLCLLMSRTCISAVVTPFTVIGDNPLVAIFSSATAGGTESLEKNNWRTSYVFELNNYAFKEDAMHESITLTGESYRLAGIWQYGMTNAWSVQLSIPYIAHRHPLFNQAIEEWHELLGLSDSARHRGAQDAFLLDYLQLNKQGEKIWTVAERKSGIGDVHVELGRIVSEFPLAEMAKIRFGINLPTGSASRLTGSGRVNYSMALDVRNIDIHLRNRDARYTNRDSDAWQHYLSLGMLHLKEAKIPIPKNYKTVGLITIGVGWAKYDDWQIKVQLDGHTPFYHSELNVLGSASVQLTVGASFLLKEKRWLDIAIVENMFSDTIPDVSLSIVLREG